MGVGIEVMGDVGKSAKLFPAILNLQGWGALMGDVVTL